MYSYVKVLCEKLKACRVSASRSIYVFVLITAICGLIAGCMITVSSTGEYTCDNGTAAAGAPDGDDDVERCARCADGYSLDGARCAQNVYTCANGVPASGNPMGDSDEERCRSCGDGYVLDDSNNTCRRPMYTCEFGMASADTPDGDSDAPRCARCNDGYHLDDTDDTIICVADVYTCNMGEPVAAGSGGADYDDGDELCGECNPGYVLDDGNNTCRQAKYTCDGGMAIDGNPDSGNSDMIGCEICYDGYHPNGMACAQNVYTCNMGEPVAAGAGGADYDDGDELCGECNQGYVFDDSNIRCRRVMYTCANGTADDGTPSGNDDEERCVACSPTGYVLEANNMCRRANYTCEFGTPTDDHPDSGNSDITQCAACDTNFVLNGIMCREAHVGEAIQIASSGGFGVEENSPDGLAVIGSTLYMVGSTNDALYTVNIDTGAATRVAPLVEQFGANESRPTGLAAFNGALYMTGDTNNFLYTVNITEGTALRVGGATNFGAVNETSPSGITAVGNTLYMVGIENDTLYTLNTTDGTAARVGTATQFGQSENIPGGLVTINDTIYMVGRSNNIVDIDIQATLYTLNSTTGVATRVGSVDNFGVNEKQPTGLAYFNNVLYMAGSQRNRLYYIPRYQDE